MRKSPRRSPSFEGLEGRALMSVIVGETENNDRKDRADVFAFDADRVLQLQGVSRNKNDRDFFAFTAPASGTLNAAVQARNGVFAQLEIEDRAGNTILETQPNNGANARSATVQSGVTYFVRLRSPVNAPAAYQVDLLLGGSPATGSPGITPGALIRESRNDDRPTQANAVALEAGKTTQLLGTASRRDRDFFAITPSVSGTVAIDALSTNGVLPKIEIHDAAGLEIFETEPKNGVNSGSVALTAGQTYFLRVSSAIDATTAYQINLLLRDGSGGGTDPGSGGGGGGGGGGGTTPPGSAIVESEPNDSKGGANLFSLSSAVGSRLQGVSANKDDRDFFSFVAAQSGTVSVRLQSTGGLADLEVEDVLSVKLLELEDGATTGQFAVTAGRRYFVRLRASDDLQASYSAELSLS